MLATKVIDQDDDSVFTIVANYAFDLEILCDQDAEIVDTPGEFYYPYTDKGVPCPEADNDWCALNYRLNGTRGACPNFDNCKLQGDGNGTVDDFGNCCNCTTEGSGNTTNTTGDTTTQTETSLFEGAKALFDVQYPPIQFAEVGKKTEITISLIELAEYKDIIELKSNLGQASKFTTFDS